MKNKKNLILITIIIILSVYIILVNYKSDNEYKLKPINAEIDKVIISKPGESIILENKGEYWNVNEYEADKGKVSKIVDAIKDLEITDKVSDKSYYERFNLDNDKAIHVIAKSKEKIVRDFYIGKRASTYKHTYIRFANKNGVYLAEDNLIDEFDKNLEDFRNKDLADIKPSDIQYVNLTYKSKSFSLIRNIDSDKDDKNKKEENKDNKDDKNKNVKQTQEWICEQQQTLQIDKNKVNEILYILNPLKAYSFPDASKKSLKTVIAMLKVKYKTIDNKEDKLVLKVHEKYENNRYLCTTNKSKYVFTMDEWRVKRLFKTIKDLKK